MGFYVSLDEVEESTLELAGYIKVAEDDLHIVYRHFGEDIIVLKDDPFIIVDDVNDAAIFGFNVIPMPPEDC
ncbi:hypothetical protein [Parasphingorhabdus sp.]|uniref:hypothetical protein n=1 Tax=Parasphingorhabdus sp. TaxID=2709688 RepID=UPI002F92CD7D